LFVCFFNINIESVTYTVVPTSPHVVAVGGNARFLVQVSQTCVRVIRLASCPGAIRRPLTRAVSGRTV